MPPLSGGLEQVRVAEVEPAARRAQQGIEAPLEDVHLMIRFLLLHLLLTPYPLPPSAQRLKT